MRDKLIRFMMGRYGMDNLNNCLLWSSLVLLIIATFTRLGLLTLISYVLMIIVIYRMLSRKIYQRENENKIPGTSLRKNTIKQTETRFSVFHFAI